MRLLPGYLHEIWLHHGDNEEELHSCIPFGPAGDGARKLDPPGSSCLFVFWADTHIDAMNIYYDFLGRGSYTSEEPWDSERYPVAWYVEQEAYALALTKHSSGPPTAAAEFKR